MHTLPNYLIMKTFGILTVVTASFMLFTFDITIAQEKRFETPSGPTSNAARVLDVALEDIAGTEGSIEVLITAVRDALEFLPEQSPAAEQLISATAQQEAGGKSEDFIRHIKMVCSMLTFQPRKEAGLPKGFPTFTPVGVVEVKEYPAYRMAVAGKFWTLFRHIQSNNISMTAPVEMRYSSSSSGELLQQSMAFLYGNAQTGELGKKGNVDVVDVGSLKVVAIGVRGKRSQATLDRAYQYLTRWIKANPDLEASGSPRVMGYNSPMVRQADSFFEVQIPLRAKPSQ
jgi:hypothetical protein